MTKPPPVLTCTVDAFKKNPLGALRKAQGEAVAVLDNGNPVFYAVPPALYEALIDELDDAVLAQLIQQRENEATVFVHIDDLLAQSEANKPASN